VSDTDDLRTTVGDALSGALAGKAEMVTGESWSQSVGACTVPRDTNGWHRKSRTTAAIARAKQYASPEHKAIRRARVAAATPDTPCGYCGNPLGPDTSRWHVPHDPQRTYLPGLWHAACNRREAARRGALLRNAQAKTRRTQTSPLTW
jgi:hypothetical protein